MNTQIRSYFLFKCAFANLVMQLTPHSLKRVIIQILLIDVNDLNHRYSVSLFRYVRKVWELYAKNCNCNMHELAGYQSPVGLNFVTLMRQQGKITQMLMHMGSIQMIIMHKSLQHLRIYFTEYQLSQLLGFPLVF